MDTYTKPLKPVLMNDDITDDAETGDDKFDEDDLIEEEGGDEDADEKEDAATGMMDDEN